MDSEDLPRLVYLGLILAALGGWVIVEFRQRMGQGLRMALAWGMIFLATFAGYGLWQDIRREMTSMDVGEGSQIELKRMQDGHYYVTLQINGTDVYFMIDTGASGMVLTMEDAQRLGFDPDDLAFLGESYTANGTVRTAMVTLPLVELGPFRDTDFRAYVNEGELFESLLGMDYLGKFRIELEGDRMILQR